MFSIKKHDSGPPMKALDLKKSQGLGGNPVKYGVGGVVMEKLFDPIMVIGVHK